MPSIDVSADGPLFDGTLAQGIIEGIDEAERKVAEQGVIMVRQHLGRVLKHPTGAYSGSITAEKKGDHWRVRDGKVYGSWLEGTSRRNERSRFKGYNTFRKVTQELQREATAIVEREIDQRIS